MSNKLINDFEVYLQSLGDNIRRHLSVISITRLYELDEITLLLKDANDGIGGDFVVFPMRNPPPSEKYDDSLCSKPPDKVLQPPKYDIGEFAEFMDWCFKQGWRIRLELSEMYLLLEKKWTGRFEIENQSNSCV